MLRQHARISMATSDSLNDPFSISTEGMRGWLKREIADIVKAKELRAGEATHFVEAYAEGRISTDEMLTQAEEYSRRWGEALPGVRRSEGMTDEQILARINETRLLQGELQPGEFRERGNKPNTRSR